MVNYFVWRAPTEFAQKLYGVYLSEKSPDRFLFLKCKLNPCNGQGVFFSFKGKKNDLDKLDCLPNSAGLPLVKKPVVDSVKSLCDSKVEVISANIIDKTGSLLDGFFVLNILSCLPCIDKTWSKFTKIPGTEEIMTFSSIVLTSNLPHDEHIFRPKEFPPMILVSSQLKDLLLPFSGLSIIGVEEYPKQ